MDGAGGVGGAGRQAGALRAQDRRACRRATAISPRSMAIAATARRTALQYILFGSAGGTLRLILRCRSESVLGDIVFDGAFRMPAKWIRYESGRIAFQALICGGSAGTHGMCRSCRWALRRRRASGTRPPPSAAAPASRRARSSRSARRPRDARRRGRRGPASSMAGPSPRRRSRGGHGRRWLRSSSRSCGAKSTISRRPPGLSSRAASATAAAGFWA